ncbi:uncharacterized protein F4822DRAFT_367249 [Hypoxylon trugodes]|uniref:uncharacterized protein n=1 Tax=Hypoxylon trugodes TaxID=326681 RepID=UPI00219C2C6A|nr:uncharacterized protein F4822DRAFT_367249 [Hypoxylon trugodes]KAI1384577.1 hypothetical protein F4822DRAFT_367249 [Hypoxylon trugodes]
MSASGKTLTIVTEDRVTFPKAPTSSSQASAKGRSLLTTTQPAEVSSSYFPEASPSPTTSTSSSETEEETPTITPSTAAKISNSMIGTNYPIPPLEREYAAPTGELDVAAQLAMKPLPRSLHSSLQRAAALPASPAVVEDGETRARKLANAKRELLALAGQI